MKNIEWDQWRERTRARVKREKIIRSEGWGEWNEKKKVNERRYEGKSKEIQSKKGRMKWKRKNQTKKDDKSTAIIFLIKAWKKKKSERKNCNGWRKKRIKINRRKRREKERCQYINQISKHTSEEKKKRKKRTKKRQSISVKERKVMDEGVTQWKYERN